ncbi:MAG: VCBS repeat-containing protein [Planctomycetes bacterium]|nr:VCBS repeat-containing protein [Planctomycetota bacterium]
MRGPELAAPGAFLGSLAAADVDRDGLADTRRSSPRSPGVKARSPSGCTFAAAAPAAVPGYLPAAVACGDLDGDGRDEALVSAADGTLSVFLGTPQGPALSKIYLAGASPPLVADMDGDGRLDASFFDPEGILVLVGRGDGTLVAPETVPAFSSGLGPGDHGYESVFMRNRGALAVGDVDRDGHPDILWLRGGPAGSVELAVAGGKGDGSLEPARSVRINDGPAYGRHTLALADLDEDGALDIVVTELGSQFPDRDGSLAVRLGNGDGAFRDAARYSAGHHPFAQAVARLDGDSHVDVAVVDDKGRMTIFYGRGDGSLEGAELSQVTARGAPLAADLDDDGHADLAIPTEGPGNCSLRVLFSDGSRSFQAREYTVGDFCLHEAVATGHLRGTGAAGLLARVDWDGLYLLSFDRRRDLRDPILLLAEPFQAAAAADLDASGVEEILLGGSENLSVFFQLGFPYLYGDPLVSPAGTAVYDLAVADLDSDGLPDVVTLGTSLVVYRNRLGVRFIRGDAAWDGVVDLTDAVAILEHLFLGAPRDGSCLDAWDANRDLEVDIADAIYLLFHLFASGSPPPEPFPWCGFREGPRGLGCVHHHPCG